jgi:hypothetical protein
MYNLKPFAEIIDVSEKKIKELVDKHGIVTLIKAICEMLKVDDESGDIKIREKYLSDLCEMLSKSVDTK